MMHYSDTDSPSRPFTPKKRATRSITVRTHVSGMKSLLPLKLSPASSPELGSPPARNLFPRSTSGPRDSCARFRAYSPVVNLSKQASQFPRLPLNTRPETYRDIPVYIDKRSPMPSPAYYPTSNFWLDWSDSNSSSDEDWTAERVSGKTESSQFGGRHRGSLRAIHNPQHTVVSGSTSISGDEATTRDSELSFKCLGEQTPPEEAIRPNAPTQQRIPLVPECHPEILAHRMTPEFDAQSWLSEGDSTDNSEDDIFGTETESGPAIAAAIGIHAAHASGRLVKIPPRSSSLAIIRPATPNSYDDEIFPTESYTDEYFPPPNTDEARSHYCPWNTFRKQSSHSMFRGAEDDDEIVSLLSSSRSQQADQDTAQSDLVRYSEDKSRQRHRLQSLHFPQPLTSAYHSMNEILSLLGDSISDVRSSLLRDYSFCITTLRSHLHPILSVGVRCGLPSISTPSQDQFPTQCKSDLRRRLTVNMPPFAGGPSCKNYSLIGLQPDGFHSFGNYNACSRHADLAPLHRIFPNATSAMVLALYTHIIASIYITQSRSCNPSVFSPVSTARSSVISSLSTKIPSKAASMLGIDTPLVGARSHHDLMEDLIFARQLEVLSENMNRYIHRLTKIMQPRCYNNEDEFTDECFMQSLVEVVTNCELQSIRCS